MPPETLSRAAQDRFREAIAAADQAPGRAGIGTLGEKTLHAVLKCYCQPDVRLHEQKLEGFVADILEDGHVVEVQTRQLDRLSRKLEAFLPLAAVTVVYPVARYRQICWVDPETGEVSRPRRSSRHGNWCHALPELYRLRSLLAAPGLQFRLLLIDVAEYRLLDGYGPEKKKRASRYERVPLELVGELWLNSPADYRLLVPLQLPERFTMAEFGRCSGLRGRNAWCALQVLLQTGAAVLIGQEGRKYIYRRCSAEAESREETKSNILEEQA